MKNETGYFEGFEQRKMFYQYWLPDSGEIRAYLIAMHGWATHSDRMAVPAKYFTEKGFAIYSFDLRGHWRNAGDLKGHVDSLNHIQQDIQNFFDLIKKEAGEKKVFLVGHSFGGALSLIYAIEHPEIPGVLVLSPELGLTLKLSLVQKIAKAIFPLLVKIAPKAQVAIELVQEDLTSDPEILKEHIEDREKLVAITATTYGVMEKGMKYPLKNVNKLKVPCLIMQAGNDKLVDLEKTKEFYEKIEIEDKKFISYEGFLHELWNEKERDKVFKDMEEWLNNHL